MPDAAWIALVLTGLGIAGLLWLRRALIRLRVSATGARASATVLAIEDTGARVNRHPVCELRLRVTPHSLGEPFEATIERTFTVAELPRLQAGARLQVRFDPEDPRHVVIESI